MIRVMVMFPLVSVPLLARILVFAVPASVVVAIALPCIFTVPASVIVSTGLPCEKNDHLESKGGNYYVAGHAPALVGVLSQVPGSRTAPVVGDCVPGHVVSVVSLHLWALCLIETLAGVQVTMQWP